MLVFAGVFDFHHTDSWLCFHNECINEDEVVLTFESVVEILKCRTIQMKATEQYFTVMLFIMLYKVAGCIRV